MAETRETRRRQKWEGVTHHGINIGIGVGIGIGVEAYMKKNEKKPQSILFQNNVAANVPVLKHLLVLKFNTGKKYNV